MSQQELMDALGQEATQRTDRIREQAKEAAAKILQKAQADLEKIKQTAIDSVTVESRIEEAKILNEARRTAKTEMADAKRKAVDAVFQALDRKLADLSKRRDYPAILKALLRECLEGVQGQAVIRCRKEDHSLVQTLLREMGQASAQIEEAPLRLGGIEVLSDSAKLIRKNTIESRLSKLHPELLQEANRHLFGRAAG